jgi:hypothetical protein
MIEMMMLEMMMLVGSGVAESDPATKLGPQSRTPCHGPSSNLH